MSDNDSKDIEKPASRSRRRLLALTAAGVGGAAIGLAGGVALAANGQPPAFPKIEGLRRFEGQSVIITGATSGIGKSTAIAFAAEGAKVAFCGRRADLGEQVAQSIIDAGGTAHFMQADVRSEEQVNKFVDDAIVRHGGLQIAFNNAGVSYDKPVYEMDIAEWDNVQVTNVRGVLLPMKRQIGHMISNGGGHIIVTSSVNVMGVRPGLAAYSASKRAVLALVQTAALEYSDRGIRINAICPGTVDTEMVRRLAGMEGAPDSAWRTMIATWANSNVHGMGRVAQPEEMASAVLAMASPDMTYLNGANFIVDGGMSIRL